MINFWKIRDLHMKKMQFYFDFLSPFSYFAWKNMHKALSTRDLEIEYHPVLMGRLFKHFEFPGPGEITVKRNSELKKCFRMAHKLNIPFSPPSEFPFNPLAINRCATLAAAGNEQVKVMELIYDSVWGKGMVLDDPELIKSLFASANINVDILERSFEREAKSELKQNIKSAIESDIFGVPTFKVENECFWGNDSIESVANFLDGNDNWNKELYTQLIKVK